MAGPLPTIAVDDNGELIIRVSQPDRTRRVQRVQRELVDLGLVETVDAVEQEQAEVGEPPKRRIGF
jgi:hypothetical protein